MSDYKLIDVTRLTKFKEKLLGILAYSTPETDAATGTSIEFIDNISQSSTNGTTTISKKKVSTFAGGNTAGLVPAPGTNASGKFLGSDGKWSKPTGTTYSNYTYSTSTKVGAAGLVPQPGTGDTGKFLKGGSGWSDLPTASTTKSGIVSLSSSTNSDAENAAATPKAIKAVYAAASTAGANAGANAASSYATAAKNSADSASTYATNAKNSADSAADAASTAVTNKIKDLKYNDPDASTETSTTFISSISQTNGVISATKKKLPTASTTNSGIVSLTDSTGSTSTTTAATPNSVTQAIKNLSYNDPSASTATSTTFISNISQTNGAISATKKKLPLFAGSSQSGIVSASEGLSENYLLNATGGWTAIDEELDATSTNPVQNKTLYNLESYHTLTYVGNSSYTIDNDVQFVVPKNTSINIYAEEPIKNNSNGYVSIYANNVGRYDVILGTSKYFRITKEKVEEYAPTNKLNLSYVRDPTPKAIYSESETPPSVNREYYFTTGRVILKLFFTGEYFIILNNVPLIAYNYFYYHKIDTGVTSFHGIKYASGLIMQWFDNVCLSDGVSRIYFPMPMHDATYTIVESRKGKNLADTTGHVEKNSEYFTVNPENDHIADFFVIGY